MFQLLLRYYKNHPAVYVKPYDGVINLLEKLKESGYKLAILSNKADEIVKEIVKVCFKPGLFDIVQGQSVSLPLKPDPMSVLNIIDRLGIDKKDVLYIGDSEVDYKTAKNANLRFLIVNYGFRSQKELMDNGIPSISHVPTQEEIERAFDEK